MTSALRIRSPHRHTPNLDRGTVTAPPPQRRAPVRESPLPTTGPHPPLFAVLGAHGGAGTSTLAQWWAPAADTGLAWPGDPRTTQRVVIAARLCLSGLTAAADRLREWHAGLAPDGVTVLALVLTAARPGATPAAVRRYAVTVTDLVPRVYRIDWHDELLVRELDELAHFTPYDPPPPRRARLTDTVPADVHRAGADLISRLIAARAELSASTGDHQEQRT